MPTYATLFSEDRSAPWRSSRWYVPLPEPVWEAMGRPSHVVGAVSGAPFRRPVRAVARVEPASGPVERRVWFGGWWVEAAGLRPGDAVDVEVSPAPPAPRDEADGIDLEAMRDRVRDGVREWRPQRSAGPDASAGG